MMLASLISASGDQDHTPSPSAFAPLASRHQSVHRVLDPTSVAIARAPLFSDQDGIAMALMRASGKAKYFLEEGWTRGANQCVSGDLSFASTRSNL
jgi:hypothetical protein